MDKRVIKKKTQKGSSWRCLLVYTAALEQGADGAHSSFPTLGIESEQYSYQHCALLEEKKPSGRSEMTGVSDTS
jgi:hypothetical protein